MESVPAASDEDPRPASNCSSCRAVTAADQRYCLDCGALLGDRRLDPIAMLTPEPTGGPAGRPPSGSSAAPPRAVPLAAATAAIVVAGISGMLVTNGGSGAGARAAVVAVAAPVAPPAAPAPEPAATPGPDADADPLSAEEEPLPEDPPPVDPLPVADEAPPAEPAPLEESPVDDDTEDDEAAEEPPPRVWLLAIEGPRAADAVERIAKQGVRLSGMEAVAGSAQVNATALVSGTRPAAVDPAAPAVDPAAPPVPAPDPAADKTPTDPAPSLPAALIAAKRTWRAYVDVQPTGGPVLPGACAAPTPDDPAATLLSSRLPFAAIPKIGCDTAVTSLEALGNDLSAGEGIPAFSYVAMGGCAAPERTAVALPDAVEDAVATITASTEYQQDGMLVVTTVGTQDACTPAAPGPVDPAAPAAPGPVPVAADPAQATPVPVAPTAVLRPAATAGKTVKAKLDLLALSRSMAEILGVTPPGSAGDDAVPALELPGS